MPALLYSARVNGLDALVVTKLDVLDRFAEVKVAEAYEVEGREVAFPSGARELARCVPRCHTEAREHRRHAATLRPRAQGGRRLAPQLPSVQVP